MSQFLHNDDNDDDDTKVIARPQVFFKNSRAKTEKMLCPNVLFKRLLSKGHQK